MERLFMQSNHTNAERKPDAVEDLQSSAVPLCIDLDGTLLKTDLLWEAALSLIKTNPGALLRAPFWLLSGRAHLKRRLAESGSFDPGLLPYRQEVLDLIQAERERRRRIVLVSAAEHTLAEQIAAYLGCFDEVIGSDGRTNLKGKIKRDVLVKKFGSKGFDYVGDHVADLPVWEAARFGFVISERRGLLRKANALGTVTPVKMDATRRLRAWMRAIRVHQWSKNVLVLVPVIMAHRTSEPAVLLAAAVAFLAFSLVSSSVYLANDLIDLEADRGHKSKRSRAFSSGLLSLPSGVFMAVVLLVAGLGLAAFGGAAFLVMLVGYYAMSFAYSAYLKRTVALDVVLLAGFYTLRIISGGAATGIPVSTWLLAFSMFFFFSLALVKRYSELKSDAALTPTRSTGRGYGVSDLPALAACGIASGLLSVLVLVLYVLSAEVTILYANPERLLLICPLLLYWISRVWILCTRGLMNEDPVVFAVTDAPSYALGVLAVVLVVLATG